MSQDNLAKFTTYGPNRGLTLAIGAYQFIDGICAVPAQDAHAASSILCRYHDVCYAHELEQKIAEYDADFPNAPAMPSASLTPDTSDIKLPPEGSEIVLVPTPLSQLAAKSAEAENPGETGNTPAADATQENGNADPGSEASTTETEADAEAAKQKEAEEAAAKEAAAKEAAAKEAAAKEPASKQHTPKKPHNNK